MDLAAIGMIVLFTSFAILRRLYGPFGYYTRKYNQNPAVQKERMEALERLRTQPLSSIRDDTFFGNLIFGVIVVIVVGCTLALLYIQFH